MNKYRFELILGGVFVALFIAIWMWQNPGVIRGPLTQPEITALLAAAEKLPMEPQEMAETITKLRAWMERDDGRAFYMLNLMRYYPELRPFPGAPDFKGTPQESNARYEELARPMVLKIGGYPMYAAGIQGKNLLEHQPELDDWSRLILVRYPSRRDFMKLLADPAYQEIEPLKVMALRVVLTPTDPELTMPSVTLVVGGVLIIVFLAIGWARAARRASR